MHIPRESLGTDIQFLEFLSQPYNHATTKYSNNILNLESMQYVIQDSNLFLKSAVMLNLHLAS
jgi:hypothetical protein